MRSEALGFTADVDRKVLSDSVAPARPHAQPTRREVDRVGLEDGGRGTSPSRQRKIDSSGLSWVVACFRVHSMTGVWATTPVSPGSGSSRSNWKLSPPK